MASVMVLGADGLAYGMILFAAAAGFSVCLSCGVFNLAHGAVFLGGTFAAALLCDGSWSGLVLAAGAALVAGSAAGAGLSWLARMARTPLDQAMATAGAGMLIAFCCTRFGGGQLLQVQYPPLLTGAVSVAGQQYPLYRIWAAGFGLMLSMTWLLVSQSRAGVVVYAVAGDRRLASVWGVRAGLVELAVVVAASALAALAGVAGAGLWPAAAGTDHRVMVLSLVVAIGGGAGSLQGALWWSVAAGQLHTSVVALSPRAAAMLPFALLALVLAGRGWWAWRTPGRQRP